MIIFIDDHRLQYVNNVKLLGTLIQNDLKWDSNVNDIVKWGILHMLRLLKSHYLPYEDRITVYRSTSDQYVNMDYGCPVWNGGLTTKQSNNLESIQKRALRIIFGNRYSTYDDNFYYPKNM